MAQLGRLCVELGELNVELKKVSSTELKPQKDTEIVVLSALELQYSQRWICQKSPSTG